MLERARSRLVFSSFSPPPPCEKARPAGQARRVRRAFIHARMPGSIGRDHRTEVLWQRATPFFFSLFFLFFWSTSRGIPSRCERRAAQYEPPVSTHRGRSMDRAFSFFFFSLFPLYLDCTARLRIVRTRPQPWRIQRRIPCSASSLIKRLQDPSLSSFFPPFSFIPMIGWGKHPRAARSPATLSRRVSEKTVRRTL